MKFQLTIHLKTPSDHTISSIIEDETQEQIMNSVFDCDSYGSIPTKGPSYCVPRDNIAYITIVQVEE